MAISIDNIPNGVLPPEIAEAFTSLLQVEGRVKFPLKDTSTSAVSTSSETPDNLGDEASIDGYIDSVDELEQLIEEAEDMADQLTKDMNIPVTGSALKAVRRLGGDNAITQAIFENALAGIEAAPLITLRQDPMLAALTGDGGLNGNWLQCSQVTAQAADLFQLRDSSAGKLPEDPVIPKNEEILDDFEGNLLQMILHIILMLWWNMIWPKFLVDLAIINPPRKIVALPLDSLIFFFASKKWKGTRYRIFKKKPQALIEEKGPINKLLNKLRIILLCKVPTALWNEDDYDPIVDVGVDCTTVDDNCPPPTPVIADSGPPYGLGSDDNTNIDIDEDGEVGISILPNDPCVTSSEFIKDVDTTVPDSLGMSPECLQAFTKIIQTVEDKAYTPKQTSASLLNTDLNTLVTDNFGI